jgi:hypothetical protein
LESQQITSPGQEPGPEQAGPEPEEQPEPGHQEPLQRLERRPGNPELHKRRKPALGSKEQEHCNHSSVDDHGNDHGNGHGSDLGNRRMKEQRRCIRSNDDQKQRPSFHRRRGRFQPTRETSRSQILQNDSF